MIAFDASQFLIDPPAFLAVADPERPGRSGLRVHISDVTRRLIDQIRVGEAAYQLRRPVTMTFYPYALGGLGELLQEPEAQTANTVNVVGRGKTYEEALADWSAKLHAQVQTLLAKRDWEKTPEEKEELAAVERLIDVPAYQRNTPYRMRQIGTVTRRRPVPDRIRWEDGTLEDVVLDMMPPEFASFHAGQRFEAVVVRTPGAGRLVRVVYVSPLPKLMPVPPGVWEALPTSSDELPLSWDEFD